MTNIDKRWELDIFPSMKYTPKEVKTEEPKKESKWFWKIMWGVLIFAVGYALGLLSIYLYVVSSEGGI